MSERVFNLPNVITLLRIAAVPLVGGLVLQQTTGACPCSQPCSSH